MAVTGSFAPNLSSSYSNIQDVLAQGANIASKMTGPAGTVAAGLQPLADEAQKNREMMFKGVIEDHLNRNKADYAAKAEGKTLVMPSDFDQVAEDHNVNPAIIKGVVPKEGVYISPEHTQDLFTKIMRGHQVSDAATQLSSTPDAPGMPEGTNKLKAQALKIVGPNENSDAEVAKILMAPVLKQGKDAFGRTYFYSPQNPLDKIYTTSSTITDESQLTPEILKPIISEQSALKKSLDPIQAQFGQINEAKKIINDPNSKGIEQGAALLRYARAAAGNVRNWKEVATVSGNPDIKDSFSRLISSKTDGSNLALGDIQSLNNVLKYDEQAAEAQANNFKESAVQRAQANSPALADRPDIVRKRVLAGTENIGIGNNSGQTVKRMQQGGKIYDVTYDSNGKYVSSQEVK